MARRQYGSAGGSADSVAVRGRASEGNGAPQSLPYPASELERVLGEYACECYAIGRGESMFYLVEDLPKLTRAAVGEILALPSVHVDSDSLPAGPPATRSTRRSPLWGRLSQMIGGSSHAAKSVIAVVPILAILAALAVALGVSVSDSFRSIFGAP